IARSVSPTPPSRDRDENEDEDGVFPNGFETVSETPAEARISSLNGTTSGTPLAILATAFQMFGLAGLFHSRNLTTHTHLVAESYRIKPIRESASKPFRNRSEVHPRSSQA